MTATLSPAAVTLLNTLAAASDPWAKYPAVLGIGHVAEILDRSIDSVRTAARRGSIPMKKRLGRWCVDQVAFRSWVGGGAR